MSYSRWIHSQFYTYWASKKSDEKEDQIFMCHMDLEKTHEITYSQAKDYLVDQEALMFDLRLDEDEVKELTFYLKQFIGDVDGHFDSEGYIESVYG